MVPAEGPSPVPSTVVHVVGRLTDSVLSYLLPLTRTLAERGDTQLLLYVPEVEQPAQVCEGLPLGVCAIPVPAGLGRTGQAAALRRGLGPVLLAQPVATLYLHGLVPGLVFALQDAGSRARPGRIMLSPHGSSQLPRVPWLRLVVLAFLRYRLRELPRMAIVTMPLEARWLSGFGEEPVQVVECPVDEPFFAEPRREAPRALLLSSSGSGHERALALYLRLAVLLLDERLGLSFNWVGVVPDRQQRACKAAGVAAFDDRGAASRAQRLGTSWVYVSLTDDGGYPLRMAEAMAAGVACVALETDVTRGLITDGEDGFLCVDIPSLLVRIAQLVDSADLRLRMGARARETAHRRLSAAAFRRRVDWAWGGYPVPVPAASMSPVMSQVSDVNEV